MSLSPTARCIACIHVFRKQRPILLIAQDEGCPPEFMCGCDDHAGAADGKIVCYEHIAALDPTVGDISFVREGIEAERHAADADWRVTEIPQTLEGEGRT